MLIVPRTSSQNGFFRICFNQKGACKHKHFHIAPLSSIRSKFPDLKMVCFPIFPSSEVLKMVRFPIFPNSEVLGMVRFPIFSKIIR